MKNIKFCICGHFGGNKNFSDGQTMKTRNVFLEIKKIYGSEMVEKLDTFNAKKNFLALNFNLFNKMKNSENIIILPGERGLITILPVAFIFSKIVNCKIHYIVIGGWLNEFITNKFIIKFLLRRINSINVESKILEKKLLENKILNVNYMPNFKNNEPLEKIKFECKKIMTYKFCTFSRVIREKGIEEAINAIKKIKEKGYDVELDIYGEIEYDYKKYIEKMIYTHKFIKYKGVVSEEKIQDVLKDYYMLLFPTYYKGEGLAGTILDAFSVGLPVIASDWRYNSEFIKDGYNGFIFNLENKEALENSIEYSMLNDKKILEMKSNCLDYYKLFKGEKVIDKFLLDIGVK